jgi:phosphatidylglycerophosphate synthase
MNKKGLIMDNIPNALTILRIVMTFIVMYMIFTGVDLRIVIVVFAFAALTDFLDGKLARKFKWESEFGRRADMIADRFLWIGTAMAFVITYGLFNNLNYIIGISCTCVNLQCIVNCIALRTQLIGGERL